MSIVLTHASSFVQVSGAFYIHLEGLTLPWTSVELHRLTPEV